MTNRDATLVSPPPMPSKSGAEGRARETAKEFAHRNKLIVAMYPVLPCMHRDCNTDCRAATAAIEARDAEAEAREAGLREALAHALVCSGSPADCDDCRDAAAPATTPRSGTAAAKEGG